MSEHIAVSSWLGTDDNFLTLGICCRSISLRIGENRGKFLIKRLFFDNFMLRAPLLLESSKMHFVLVILL